MARCSAFALCVLALSCKSATPPTGFGVDMTIDYRALSRRALVRTLDVATSGAETYQKMVSLGADVQAAAIAHIRYVPEAASGVLHFVVSAFDESGALVGTISKNVTLLAGAAVLETFTLEDVSGVMDASMPPDLGPTLLEPGATCTADGDCATNTCVAEKCELASGPPNWTTVQMLPAGRFQLGAWGADTIYVAGGIGTAVDGTTLRFDGTTNSWCGTCGTEIVPGPQLTPRQGFASAVAGGKLFAIGGLTSADASGMVLSSIELFDPAMQMWTLGKGALATPRVDCGAALGADNLLYVVGGQTAPTSGVVATVETVDATGTTVVQVAPLPTARDYLAAATDSKGRILAIGGSPDDKVSVTEVDIYDTTTKAWTTAAPLSTGRALHGAALGGDGRVYVVAGQDASGVPLATAEALTADADHWTPVASVAVARTLTIATRGPDCRVYSIGGSDGTAPQATVEAYGPVFVPNPTTGSVGRAVDLSLTNFAANSHVTVTFSGDTAGTSTVRATADANGDVKPSPAWNVPSVMPGTYTLTAVDDRARYPVTQAFAVK